MLPFNKHTGPKLSRSAIMNKLALAGLCLLLLTVPSAWVIFAQSGTVNDASDDALVKERLSQALAGASQGQLSVASLRETPMPGLLQVELNTGEVLFTDRTGEFLLTGDLFRTIEGGLVNLSNEARKQKTVELIAAIPEQEMIVFRPAEVKATIDVFTDVDCTYCRKLHGDIEEILSLGIAVRYLAFPRGGPSSAVFPKMVSVWCADDRKRAMTQAKNGQNLPERQCDNPVSSHFQLGNQIGISGTPAIVLQDGSVIPGYLDVERLAEIVLNQ
jgi:thiol:disulfide interchange protein DsbC